MRINIVTGFFLPVPPQRGGATEKIWFELSRRFAQRGHRVTFISRRWPGFADEETIDGVRHIRLSGWDHSASLPRNLFRDWQWGSRVAKRLPPSDATICNAVFLPILLRRRRPDAGKIVAVVARMPKGQTRFYGGVDLLLSLSSAVTAAIGRENPALASRIAGFPFPIDWHALAAAGARRETSPAVRIAYIGRIHPEKGIDVLLGAAASLLDSADLPPWQLDLTGPVSVAAGGGGETYRDELVAQWGSAGNRLHFHEPEFQPERLAATYAAADVFCYPSIAERGETFGVAVAEAMAARCAVVVSALDCFRDLVTPDATGLVFNHRTARPSAELAAQVRRLLVDPTQRETIAAAGQTRARVFDYENVCDAVLDDLERLVR